MKLTIENKMIERLLTSEDWTSACLGAALIDDVLVPLYLVTLNQIDRYNFREKHFDIPHFWQLCKRAGLRVGMMPYHSARLEYIKNYYATNNLG